MCVSKSELVDFIPFCYTIEFRSHFLSLNTYKHKVWLKFANYVARLDWDDCKWFSFVCQMIDGSDESKRTHSDHFEEFQTDPKFKIARANCKHCKSFIFTTLSNMKIHLANREHYVRSVVISLWRLAPFSSLHMVATNTNNLKASLLMDILFHEQSELVIGKLIAHSMAQSSFITRKSSSIADCMNAKI